MKSEKGCADIRHSPFLIPRIDTNRAGKDCRDSNESIGAWFE